MDSKWLESYERAALYGETLEVLDYSPEIDTNLKVICFQTFVGHCGCILFNVDEMKFSKRVGRIAPFFSLNLQKKTLSMSFRYEKDVVSVRYAV